MNNNQNKVLKLLEEYWSMHPHQRFCQLIMNVLNMSDDPYYVPNERLITELKLKLEKEK